MRTEKIICAALAAAMLPLGGFRLERAAKAAPETTVVRLDPSNSSPFNGGKFEGWGTSMGWWGNRLGYSDDMSQQAAEELYSEDGLGLDIVRYNVGGGDDPTHNHITRSDSKLPCFAVPETEADGSLKTDEDGNVLYSYDWEADHNQVNVLTRIKDVNPDVHIEGYTNSPPWFMTNSGCSSGGVNAAENLDPKNYGIFAEFLADVTQHMAEIGLPFDSYSPMNEPDPRTNYWGANSPKQEGNHVAPGANQSGLLKALKDEYASRNIDTLVAGPDETDIGYTISSYNALTDEGKAALDRIDTHTYGGSNRAGLKQTAVDAGKNLWMSEVDGGWNGFGLADRIITDLNGMQASAWVMWDIIDFHKDSEFVCPTGDDKGKKTEAGTSLDPTGTMWGVGMGNHDAQKVEWANKYYAYGQFTRYINPGDTLIASSNSTLAAYNETNGDIKIVVNNSGSNDVPYEFDLSAFKTIGNTVEEIRSNNLTGEKAEHWAEIPDEAEITDKKLTTTAKAGTITTYVIKGSGKAQYAVVNGGDGELLIGGTVKMGLATNIDGTQHWSVAQTENASIEQDGTLTINKPGDITVSAEIDGFTVSKTINVPLTVKGGDGEILIGGNVPMSCNVAEGYDGTVTWSVGENAAADISPEGVLTIKKSGTVTVIVNVDGVTAEKTITAALTIKGGGSELHTGDTLRLSCNVAEDYDGTVVWSAEPVEAAEIDPETGELTAVGPGTASVTVTVTDSTGAYTSTATKEFKINEYMLSGTASWNNDDKTDYRMAADGSFSTYFDGLTNGWVMYDYGKPYKVSDIKLAARSGDSYAARTVGGEVQASNDGINWTTLYTIESALPAEAYTTLTAEQLGLSGDKKAYRYYRYTNSQHEANISEFIIEGAPSDDTDIPENDPTVKDIAEFTDNFEGCKNIFSAAEGDFSEDGNQIFASGLERFGNVFAPVNATGSSVLNDAITLTENDRFRMKLNMFSGWEDSGRENTFAINDADGSEIIALRITGGGYTLEEIRVCGTNILSGNTGGSAQCKAPGNKGANGWDSSQQRYQNNVGYNKTLEILIDGTGTVNVSFTGGSTDNITAAGVIDVSENPITIGSIALTGNYNASRARTVSYDNLDADVITYKEALPKPPEKPEIPADGTLISLDFNGNLESGSAYGKAEPLGTPVYEKVDGRQALKLNGTNNTAIKLTDANGSGLLEGFDEITVSFSFKQTADATSWWFYSAPNNNSQTYNSEYYVGALGKSGGTLSIERYNNGRSNTADGAFALNAWHDVIISFEEAKTLLYIDGELKATVDSTFKISDMLGSNPIAYIGRANWGTNGEFATGYIDDFVIKQGAYTSLLGGIELGDTSAVKGDITIPVIDGVTWESSDPNTVGTDGKVTRRDKTVTVTLTAKNGDDTRNFTVTVIGLTAFADTFTAYSDNGSIKFTADEETDNPYQCITALYDDSGRLLNVKYSSEGSFDEMADGTYKVSFFLWDSIEGMSPKHDKMTKTVTVRDEPETAAYLFVHFVGSEKNSTDEQMYFTISDDAMTWKTLNNNAPVLTSSKSQNGIRDPYILRGEDGKFYIIATDLSIVNGGLTWSTSQTQGSRKIVVWKSDDLTNWSYSLHEVMPEGTGCVWAPEAIYDREKGQYMVFWASKTSADQYAKQRIYRCYTSDFETFTPAEVYIEEDHSVIDTTIVEDKGVYYRFNKYEGQNFVYMEKCNSLDGKWEDVTTYNHKETGFEGPTIFKMNNSDKWCLMLDNYSRGGYKPFMTEDLSSGVFQSPGDVTFESGITYRHGTVLPITAEEKAAIIQAYGNN